MVYFNLAGILIGLLGGAAAAIPLYALGTDDMTLGMTCWLTAVALVGAVYDKPAPPDGLLAYARWYSGGDSRIAVLGAPVVFWPLFGAVFGMLFPLLHGDPLPAWWFFLVILVTPLALLVVRVRTATA